MKAKSIKGNSPEEIQNALNESMADGFKPTLAFVFLSIKQDRDAIAALLDASGIAIYGTTTNGEFIDEEFGQGAVAILLLEINTNHFSIFFEEYADKNYREVTQKIARQALEKFATPAFIISGSDVYTDAELLLHGFEDIIGKEVNVFGGMSGDDFTFTEQFVFTNGKYSKRGLVVLALDENKIIVKGRATCGWKPVGTEKTVTRSEGNRIYTIDNIPALDMASKFSGITNITQENAGLGLEMATSLPLLLQRENGEAVMRPGVLINWEDHSVTCSGTVPQGSKVRFSLPPDFDVIEKVIQEIEKLKETEMPAADAVIVFNCAGRFMTLGPLLHEEIEGVKKVWGVPMAGFFSFGELARATHGNLEMHNMTTVCVALKEK
jgi:hypothetical protein